MKEHEESTHQVVAPPADEPRPGTTVAPAPATHQDASLVLIADDEEPIAETLALIVSEAGYTPMLASHGQHALELARVHWPALVITDVMMPYLDGVQLIASLRDQAEREGQVPMPIIAMTAGSMERAWQAGADAVLSKPFDLEQVETLLTRFLGRPAAARDDSDAAP